MPLRIEINRQYLERAIDLAIGSLTRASNQKGINPLVREIYQKDAAIYADAKAGITEMIDTPKTK